MKHGYTRRHRAQPDSDLPVPKYDSARTVPGDVKETQHSRTPM